MDYRKLMIVAGALGALALPGVAQAADRDSDGLPDRWEQRHHLSTTTNSANVDQDRDRVDNLNEYEEGTQPRDRDSDGDGRGDGREDRDRDGLDNAGEDLTGSDPTDRDTDGDGIPDGREQAGVVSAYADGVVTIDLASGGSVSARVTDDTVIRCASEEEAATAQAAAGPGGRGCDGFDRQDGNCPEGTLAVGAVVHEAVIRQGWDGAELVKIEILT